MYVIGLTGNIATGKSTVAHMLERLGAEVLDADKLAHWVMRPGTEVYHRIVQRFGRGVLVRERALRRAERSRQGDDSIRREPEIDRRALGRIVFADPQALADLEQIVHPEVVLETLRWLQRVTKPVAVIEAVKLLEAQIHVHCDVVWVVTSPRAVQEQRLRTTRHLTQAEAKVRIDAQPPQRGKVRFADVVIDNSGSLENSWQQVLHAWNAIPSAPHWPDETPWIAAQPAARPRSLRALWRSLLLAVGMVALVLIASGGVGLTIAQRAWFASLAALLGLACSWLMGWE